MNNDWKIEQIESDEEHMMAGCYYISKEQEPTDEELTIMEEQQEWTTSLYLCQDGVARRGCTSGVLPPFTVEKILASSESGYFKTLEEAQQVLREFGR